jgi:hypothetical protein
MRNLRTTGLGAIMMKIAQGQQAHLASRGYVVAD